jgi:Phytochelatin synthase
MIRIIKMRTCPITSSSAVPKVGTFYMRSLPRDLDALDSNTGRALFREALLEGTMEGYFKLAQQFHTQAEPAYCGLGSLVCALNALQIDPARPWKGPWRWFSEELLTCCKSLQEIGQSGLTLDEVACLARCSGATVSVYRPPLVGIDEFREHVRAASTDRGGPVLIVNYSRKAVGQTGDGHFSPIGGYHVATDRVLVLDTARFKYPPHWLSLELLFEATRKLDRASHTARGWLMLQRSVDPAPGHH